MQEILLRLYQLQHLEMEVKRLTAADKQTIVELRAKIPEPILAHYDRMRLRGKLAVCYVRHRVCSGCHMSVPIGTITVLKRGQDIQLCGNCGRYLLLEPETPPPPAPAPAPKAAPKKRQPKVKSEASPAKAAAEAPAAAPASEAAPKTRRPRKAKTVEAQATAAPASESVTAPASAAAVPS